MTRQHFKALADEIRDIRDSTARKCAAIAVANACRRFNGRFDRDKFYLACGVEA